MRSKLFYMSLWFSAAVAQAQPFTLDSTIDFTRPEFYTTPFRQDVTNVSFFGYPPDIAFDFAQDVNLNLGFFPGQPGPITVSALVKKCRPTTYSITQTQTNPVTRLPFTVPAQGVATCEGISNQQGATDLSFESGISVAPGTVTGVTAVSLNISYPASPAFAFLAGFEPVPVNPQPIVVPFNTTSPVLTRGIGIALDTSLVPNAFCTMSPNFDEFGQPDSDTTTQPFYFAGTPGNTTGQVEIHCNAPILRIDLQHQSPVGGGFIGLLAFFKPTQPPTFDVYPSAQMFVKDMRILETVDFGGRPYEILKKVTNLAGQNEPSADFVNMVPSINACGRLSQSRNRKRIEVLCVDAANNEPVSGCRISASLTLGGNEGGHSHADARPLGTVSPQSATIPLTGLVMEYEAPEASGDVVVDFSAFGPDNSNIAVSDTTFSVGIQVPLVNLAQAGLSFVVASHPNEGNFGTVGMKFAVNDMMTRYFENTAILQIQNPTPVRSTGATLSRGGIFDVDQNWSRPHCTHRNGEVMDIGLARFVGTRGIFEKIALEHAARNAGLKFWVVGERPEDDAANHWHATLK